MIKVEPYWNVKMLQGQMVDGIDTIKVEPYWNVKQANNVDISTPLD